MWLALMRQLTEMKSFLLHLINYLRGLRKLAHYHATQSPLTAAGHDIDGQ